MTTMQSIPSEDSPRLVVRLGEWDRTDPSLDPRLKGMSLAADVEWRRLADTLRGRIDIHERYDGITIETASFVGRVDVGPLRIVVQPKLAAMPLTRLLRYAYGLRDVTSIDETRSPTDKRGMHDLLIALLAGEVEELLHRGLPRHYVAQERKLDSPRGQILIDQIIRRGGVLEPTLPCRQFERRADWSLNRVLRAGLDSAARLSEDRDLRRHVQRLSTMFGDVREMPRLGIDDIDVVERNLTRLTAACRPALTLIRLLQEMQGVELETDAGSSRTPGFLFDMNLFFQRLLSRFLRENLVDARIVDEHYIQGMFAYAPTANPKRRRAPSPRPDYALFRGKRLHNFLDAKYRELWQKSLPVEWLYQLTIYALASPDEVSVMLYASMSESACDEKVEIRQPVSWSNKAPASVILRPVPLGMLATLVGSGANIELVGRRQQLAQQLVANRANGAHLWSTSFAHAS
jgi:5-methylcytosine-specific restriction enzyme subunit McrC